MKKRCRMPPSTGILIPDQRSRILVSHEGARFAAAMLLSINSRKNAPIRIRTLSAIRPETASPRTKSTVRVDHLADTDGSALKPSIPPRCETPTRRPSGS